MLSFLPLFVCPLMPTCLPASQTDSASGGRTCAAGCPPGGADGARPGAAAACPCADHAQGSDAR